MTEEEFFTLMNELYNDKIDFSKYNFINLNTKSKCKCNVCGYEWNGLAKSLKNGHGCYKCSRKLVGLKRRNKKIEVYDKLKKVLIEGSEILTEYVTAREHIYIKCPKGHIYHYKYHDLLYGHGCPECNESRFEKTISIMLTENQIDFSKNDRKILGGLELDFYIPSKNIAIECQGEQHFIPKSFGCRDNKVVEENFVKQQQRDISKKQKCQDQGIKLIYFLDKEYNGFMTENDTYFNNTDDLLEYINNF